MPFTSDDANFSDELNDASPRSTLSANSLNRSKSTCHVPASFMAQALSWLAPILRSWLAQSRTSSGQPSALGYRTGPKPTIRIEHHKTGAVIDHPLEDGDVKFYAEAEAILAKLTRRGIPMILREVEDGIFKPYSFSGMQKIVQRMRKHIGLPVEFTLDACRHGGMTELEEAELTEGQGRALSAHRTKESYAGYAKRTEARLLSATRKRHAHAIANQMATNVQNAEGEGVQNESAGNTKSA